MALSGIINTNVSALNTLNALNSTQGSLNTYLQQLSTGKQINGPADNPAGYAIAQRFQTQINGLNQAVSNGNQAVSLVQTATGAIQNQTSLLQQIRTTAVQAANASNTSQDRQALQGVVSQLLAQVQTIATQTQFNGQNLLDGTFSGAQFQVGSNANQIINVSISNSQSNAIGNNTLAASTGGVYTTSGAFTNGGYTLGSAFTISSGGGNFTAGSVSISGSAGAGSVTVAADESANNIAASVNAVSQSTGVTATATNSVAFTVTSGSFAFSLSNGTSGSASNTVNISANVTGVNPTGLSGLVSAINNSTAQTGVAASVNSSNQLVLTQSNGQNMLFSGFGGSGTLAAGGTTLSSGASSGVALVQGAVQFQSTQGYALSGGSKIGLTDISNLTAVSTVNVSTAEGAQQAISVVDQAINTLNQQNGSLGAIQNRIQASVSNDQTTATNLQSAQSVVQDANIAQATSQLTKYQILQQAGISTLAQANALQQSYLKLLP